jgi:hypothetical protein
MRRALLHLRRPGLALTALLMLGASCDSEAPRPPPPNDGVVTCNVVSCLGCCQGNACVLPPTDTACGTGGFPCTDCSLVGQTCNTGSGTCQAGPACGPGLCNGCCQGDTCIEVLTDSACGKGGNACVDCTLSSETCSIGAGICQGGGSCGPGSCGGCCQGTTCLGGSIDNACGSGGNPCIDCTQNSQTCDTGSGTCQGVGTCGPGSCNGCCQGSTCIQSLTDSACGSGGNACVDCTQNSQTCDTGSGTCQGGGSCGPGSCNGCCQGNTCILNLIDSACGSGGNACVDCTQYGQTCNTGSGTCQSVASMYAVILQSASLLVSPWVACNEGNCDMYVELTVGNLTATSSIVADNNSPVWNEQLMITSASDITTSFSATVRDDDYGPDIHVAYCNPTVTSADLQAGQLTVTCSYIIDICQVTFGFVPN